MLASELIKEIEKLIKQYGDVKVTSFDLDRDLCDIKEIEFSSYPEPNIYIGS